jgi:hypothetical protein
MTDDYLPFRVLRSNVDDELLARAINMVIAKGAYSAAAQMYPDDKIELRQGARVSKKANRNGPASHPTRSDR